MYRFLDYVIKYLRNRYFRKKYKYEHDYMASMIRWAGHAVESWAKRLTVNQSDYNVKMTSESASELRDLLKNIT